MRQEHVCLFEKIPFEIYAYKEKRSKYKITVIKTKETLHYIVQQRNKLE